MRYDIQVQTTVATTRPGWLLRRRLPLLLVLLLALIWRLLLWAQPLHLPANDEVEYITVARELLAGRGWSFYEQWRWLRAPLYPLFLAGSLWLAGGDLHMAALPNIGLSVLNVLLVALLAREVTQLHPHPPFPASAHGKERTHIFGKAGQRPMLLAAGVAAVLQTNATFASLYMSETLWSTLFSAMLLALAQWRRRRGLGWAALAGALFGLACLTRSALLVLLPAVLLWLLWLELARERRLWIGAVAPGAAMGLAAALVIAPWSIRNCQAYSSCILIESGFAYNLWAFYEPREELDTINATLEAIPDPAERADVATRRGLERLREDPWIVARKLPAEWERLWVVKPIQDRFVLPDYYGDPPPVLFLSGLVFDDLLYVLVLCSSALGLALLLSRGNSLAVLLALWMAVFITATLLTHAEGRYRHFLFPALIPLAAIGVDAVLRRSWPRLRWTVPAAILLMLALLPLTVYYPWQWAGGGAARSVYRWQGDQRFAAGNLAGAAQAYRAALQARETPDGWLALGRLRRAQGDAPAAEEAFRLALALESTYVGASAQLGDLLRAQGRAEEAQQAFRGRYVAESRAVDWSYRFLEPAPVAFVDVGAGLDYGYIAGVYAPEEQQGASARWTDGRGLLRLEAGAEPVMLTLRVAAPGHNSDAVPLEICTASCVSLTLGSTWREIRVLLPTSGTIELRSPTFSAPDGRKLGVLVDYAQVDTTH